MQDQHDGVAYRVRRTGSAPIALAIFMVLAMGTLVAVDRNRAAWLYGTIAAFNGVMWVCLMGPAASVTVRRATLDIRNPVVRYLVPRGRVNSFGDAVLGDPAPPDIREVETRIRWANLLGTLIGAAALGWLLFAKPY